MRIVIERDVVKYKQFVWEFEGHLREIWKWHDLPAETYKVIDELWRDWHRMKEENGIQEDE